MGTESSNGHGSGFSHAPSTHMEALCLGTNQQEGRMRKWLPRSLLSTLVSHQSPCSIPTTHFLLPFEK